MAADRVDERRWDRLGFALLIVISIGAGVAAVIAAFAGVQRLWVPHGTAVFGDWAFPWAFGGVWVGFWWSSGFPSEADGTRSRVVTQLRRVLTASLVLCVLGFLTSVGGD